MEQKKPLAVMFAPLLVVVGIMIMAGTLTYYLEKHKDIPVLTGNTFSD